MPIVITCPTCKRRYDPGIEDDLSNLPKGVSMKVVCPACGQWLRIPERERIPAPAAPPHVLQEMMKQSTLVEDPPPPLAEDSPLLPRKSKPPAATGEKPWWKFW